MKSRLVIIDCGSYILGCFVTAVNIFVVMRTTFRNEAISKSVKNDIDSTLVNFLILDESEENTKKLISMTSEVGNLVGISVSTYIESRHNILKV